MARDPNFALYARASTRIEPLAGRVDAWPVEEHLLEMATTENPIESGSTLTDHAVRRRERLTLTGWVADLLPAAGNERATGAHRAAEAWARIATMFRERQPVTVHTELRTYQNMLITRATAPVDVGTGRSLRFELRLAELLFADTELLRLAPDTVSEDGPAADRVSTVDGGDRRSETVPPPDLS